MIAEYKQIWFAVVGDSDAKLQNSTDMENTDGTFFEFSENEQNKNWHEKRGVWRNLLTNKPFWKQSETCLKNVAEGDKKNDGKRWRVNK